MYWLKELGEYCNMTDKREKQLNEIGFQWNAEASVILILSGVLILIN